MPGLRERALLAMRVQMLTEETEHAAFMVNLYESRARSSLLAESVLRQRLGLSSAVELEVVPVGDDQDFEPVEREYEVEVEDFNFTVIVENWDEDGVAREKVSVYLQPDGDALRVPIDTLGGLGFWLEEQEQEEQDAMPTWLKRIPADDSERPGWFSWLIGRR